MSEPKFDCVCSWPKAMWKLQCVCVKYSQTGQRTEVGEVCVCNSLGTNDYAIVEERENEGRWASAASEEEESLYSRWVRKPGEVIVNSWKRKHSSIELQLHYYSMHVTEVHTPGLPICRKQSCSLTNSIEKKWLAGTNVCL